MTDAYQGDQSVFRLVYRSHSKIGSTERDTVLGTIFDVARSNNKRAGITGALLMTDHYFVQALEGDETAVSALYEKICEDSRHEKVAVLESGPVPARAFSRWSMAQVSKSGQADIPLHNKGGSIHRAAPEHSTAQQDKVLTVMRNAIGADTV